MYRTKDVRKAIIPKFDSSKQDLFVHWYKLFCSTWAVGCSSCPPYESAQEDIIYGAWWMLLQVNAPWIVSCLVRFTLHSFFRERFLRVPKRYSAVEGCPPNAGYPQAPSPCKCNPPPHPPPAKLGVLQPFKTSWLENT